MKIGNAGHYVGSISLLGLFLLLASACSPVAFHQRKTSEPSALVTFPDTLDPVAPPALPPTTLPSVPATVPPEVPSPALPVGPPSAVLSKGACAADSSTRLISCMTCDIPPIVIVPQFSRKGQALYDIMATGCQVRNQSDPVGYQPPSSVELMRRLNRLSPTLYPDSTMTELQRVVVNSLLTNPQTLQSFFGGVWYSGVTPATTAFETYFGLETVEARYALCYGSGEGISSTFSRFNTTELHSKEWFDCQYSGTSFNCRERPEYVVANTYRTQLRRAMNESINNPYFAPPDEAAKVCDWEKYEGDYDSAAKAQLLSWLATGFKVGAEDSTMCSVITSPPPMLSGKVILAAYRCK